MRLESRGAEDRGRRSEDRGRRSEDRGRRSEDRGRRSEDRGRRAEVRGPRDTRHSTLATRRLPPGSAFRIGIRTSVFDVGC
ncbi:MAG: hypothetical protein FJ221_14160 [Lentisphaerae bacterium]|nr:hypothetical protein [Lentisphaerota bacterium]